VINLANDDAVPVGALHSVSLIMLPLIASFMPNVLLLPALISAEPYIFTNRFSDVVFLSANVSLVPSPIP
jgi:hypothetical protein